MRVLGTIAAFFWINIQPSSSTAPVADDNHPVIEFYHMSSDSFIIIITLHNLSNYLALLAFRSNARLKSYSSKSIQYFGM